MRILCFFFLSFWILFLSPVITKGNIPIDAPLDTEAESNPDQSLAIKAAEQHQETGGLSNEGGAAGAKSHQASTTSTDPSDPSEQDIAPTATPDTQEVDLNATPSEKEKEALKIRYYQVRTQVEKQPILVELRHRAENESTDEGKRQVLRSYYELLFKNMVAIDSSLTQRCEVMKAAYMRRLAQISIEPTIPLGNPVPPTDLAPAAQSTAAASPPSSKETSTTPTPQPQATPETSPKATPRVHHKHHKKVPHPSV